MQIVFALHGYGPLTRMLGQKIPDEWFRTLFSHISASVTGILVSLYEINLGM